MPLLKPKKEHLLAEQWRTITDHHVIGMEWTRDRRQMVVASVEGPISLLESSTGRLIARLAGHDHGTSALAIHPQKPLLASAGQDGRVRFWNLSSVTEIASLEAGSSWAERIAWSPDGSILASAAGRSLRLWSTEGKLLHEQQDHPSTISDIAWRPGSLQLALAAYGGVILYDLAQPEKPPERFHWKGSTLVLSWSPNGAMLATGDQDSTVHFWYANSGEDLQMWGYPTKVKELSWDKFSRFLATGGGPAVCIWDCSGAGPAGSKPEMLSVHEEPITSLAYQHQGFLLASGAQDKLVIIWAPKASTKPRGFTRLPSACTILRWSPDDTALAVGCGDGTVAMIVSPT
jgi:WD40 repeat protein